MASGERRTPGDGAELDTPVRARDDRRNEALGSHRGTESGRRGRSRDAQELLRQDLLRLTDYLGRADEHLRFDQEFALVNWPTQQRFRERVNRVRGGIPGMRASRR